MIDKMFAAVHRRFVAKTGEELCLLNKTLHRCERELTYNPESWLAKRTWKQVAALIRQITLIRVSSTKFLPRVIEAQKIEDLCSIHRATGRHQLLRNLFIELQTQRMLVVGAFNKYRADAKTREIDLSRSV